MQQGGGLCIPPLSVAFLYDQNWIMPFGLIEQIWKAEFFNIKGILIKDSICYHGV